MAFRANYQSFVYAIRNTQDVTLVVSGARLYSPGATGRSGCLVRPLLAVESAEIIAHDFRSPDNESGAT